jgi:hypothetical protein
MKVTALLPEKMIAEVRKLSKGKNITDSLRIALKEWIELKHITDLNGRIAAKPMEFTAEYSAPKVRELNRRR